MTVSEILDRPGPGQVETLLNHPWLTLGIGDLPVSTIHNQFVSLLLFTDGRAWDRYLEVEAHSHGRLQLSGRELVTRLLGRSDFDAIYVDPHTQPERAPFPPSFVAELARGRDPRQVVNILPARSVAEIHLFFEDEGYPTPAHQIIEERDQLVAQYGRFRFSLVGAQSDPDDFGQGPSQILCAGKILRRLSQHLDHLRLARWESGQAGQALRLLNELEKLMVPGSSIIERASLRSCEGARFWRDNWWLTQDLAATRALLEKSPGAAEDWQEPPADSLEDAVSQPAPGQLRLLLESQWLVWRGPESLAPIPGQTVFAFTGPERLTGFLEQLERARHMSLDHNLRKLDEGWLAVPVVNWDERYRNAYATPISGHELFIAASQPGVCDSLRINAGAGTYSVSLILPDVLEMLAGRDPRPGASILQARSRAEIDAYLSQNSLNRPRHRRLRLNGKLVDEYSDNRKRFYFYPVDLDIGHHELAPGRTSILCAGYWTRVLSMADSLWEPDLPEQWRQEKACWAAEMLKLVDPASQRIPLSEVRSAHGLSAVKHQPGLLEADWLHDLQRKLQI
ncbi:MAG: hypothetical protein U0931_31585 [Vulcanimicrobiota bacterium]